VFFVIFKIHVMLRSVNYNFYKNKFIARLKYHLQRRVFTVTL